MSATEGLNKILANLADEAKKAKNAALEFVAVGYSADYALPVHEDLQRIHPNGQAKFLEQPMRLLAGQFGKAIAQAVKEGKTLPQAQLEAGEILLTESQKLVPVQTGTLRDSGYVKVEES